MAAQRGLTPEQVRYIAENGKLLELVKREELFFGIRNGYFNLYYRGSSLGKFTLLKGGGLKIETAPKYLEKGGGDNACDSLEQLLKRYEEIRASIARAQERGWKERSAQQALILANNRNPDSKWYCVDMEYVQAQDSGRFDVVAVRRKPDGEGCHRVALIELKVGYGSYDGDSGIVGHLADFCRFEGSGRFETLREEVCAILSNKRALDFEVPCPVLRPDDLEKTPHFYFLTLTSDMDTCRTKMKHRLGIEVPGRRGGLATYHARRVLGSTFLDRDNYHFLFAPEEMSERERVDILEEADIETL